jgi:hypothetical protein
MPLWYYLVLGLIFLGLVGFLVYKKMQKSDDD